jgi:hypothetical protein
MEYIAFRLQANVKNVGSQEDFIVFWLVVLLHVI